MYCNGSSWPCSSSIAQQACLGTDRASLGGTISEGRCCDLGNFSKMRLSGTRLSGPTLTDVTSGLTPSVPAARIKGGHVLWVVERDKAVKVYPSNKSLSIGTAGSIVPVDMWTIKIASIENGVRAHWEIRRLQSHRWRVCKH